MLTLRSSPASPFGRKVKIAAHLLGLADRITVIVADTQDASDDLRRQNPLGKIPTLILETGEPLYDSRVIVAYLDDLAGGGRLIPAGGKRRIDAMRHEALADGLLDAALLQVYEGRYRPAELRVASWVELQAGKTSRALDHLEASLSRPADPLHVGHIAQACALGYLDLRFDGAWRRSYPALVAWLDDFSDRVPAFAATAYRAG